uniref:Retrovirus-related Pol polyprotein from transposon 17.6 n=1 Tax=Tanacetum cinerariifolium TaxID=118510 RepID=A0A6L2LUV6_TANCI|nr:retrovirus-related Pol polyprotein from transposon 17.6 [Tanacetum cinerariifolium]
MNTASSSGSGSLPSNTVPNPQEDLKAITTRSGVTLAGPSVSPHPPSKEVDQEPKTITDQVLIGSTNNVPPPVVQPSPVSTSSTPMSSPKMPEVTKDTKLPEKLGDPDMFLIPCDFPELDECLALADLTCEEYVQEVLGFYDNFKSGNPTPTSDPIIALSFLSLTLFEGGDFILEEIEACFTSKSIPQGINDTDLDVEGDILLLEELLNNDPSSSPLPPKELNVEEIKTVKSSIDEPPELELKDLPSHLEYTFLGGTDKLPVIISKELKDEEKSAILKVPKSHKRAIAWKISDIKGIDPLFCTHKILIEDDFKPMVQHQRRVNSKILEVIKKEVIKLLDAGLIYPIFDSPWVILVHCVPKKGGMTVVENEDNKLIPTRCMMAIFHDMIHKTMEVFMDDFSVFDDSFSSCLSHLDKMLQRCEGTNLVLNWEKCHFMVKEGIVLGHKISMSEIEVDRAKVDLIATPPHPTSVKGVRSFLGYVGFYRRFNQDFSKISQPMTHLLEKETPFNFSKECIESFNTLKKKLTEAPILVSPDWDLPFEIMCDASDYAVGAVLG